MQNGSLVPSSFVACFCELLNVSTNEPQTLHSTQSGLNTPHIAHNCMTPYRDDIDVPRNQLPKRVTSRGVHVRPSFRYDTQLSPIAGSPNVDDAPPQRATRMKKRGSISYTELPRERMFDDIESLNEAPNYTEAEAANYTEAKAQSGLNYSEPQSAPNNGDADCEMDRNDATQLERRIDALRYALLTVAPANRRKLYVLARFISKLVDDDDTESTRCNALRFDATKTNRCVAEHCFAVPMFGDASTYDSTAHCALVRFLVAHYRAVFVVPNDMRAHANTSGMAVSECSNALTDASSKCSKPASDCSSKRASDCSKPTYECIPKPSECISKPTFECIPKPTSEYISKPTSEYSAKRNSDQSNSKRNAEADKSVYENVQPTSAYVLQPASCYVKPSADYCTLTSSCSQSNVLSHSASAVEYVSLASKCTAQPSQSRGDAKPLARNCSVDSHDASAQKWKPPIAPKPKLSAQPTGNFSSSGQLVVAADSQREFSAATS